MWSKSIEVEVEVEVFQLQLGYFSLFSKTVFFPLNMGFGAQFDKFCEKTLLLAFFFITKGHLRWSIWF